MHKLATRKLSHCSTHTTALAPAAARACCPLLLTLSGLERNKALEEAKNSSHLRYTICAKEDQLQQDDT